MHSLLRTQGFPNWQHLECFTDLPESLCFTATLEEKGLQQLTRPSALHSYCPWWPDGPSNLSFQALQGSVVAKALLLTEPARAAVSHPPLLLPAGTRPQWALLPQRRSRPVPGTSQTWCRFPPGDPCSSAGKQLLGKQQMNMQYRHWSLSG